MGQLEMIRRLILAAALALSASVAAAQPATWNYSAVPGQNSKATYPGDVTILGTCTGCGAGSGAAQLNVPQTWTATQTFAGGTSTLDLVASNIGELFAVPGGGAIGPPTTTNYDVLSASIVEYNTSAANNWTLNIRGSATASLDSILASSQGVTVALIARQGATPFFNNVLQIDGVTQAPVWQGGAPTAGNANGLDVYTYTILKFGTASWLVLASVVQFK